MIPACTVSERLAACDRDSLVPVATMLKVPVAALAAAEKTKEIGAPALILNGLAGFETTPEGKPVRAT